MSSWFRTSLWFALPFLLALAALTGIRAWLVNSSPQPRFTSSVSLPDASALLGLTLPVDELLEAQSRAPLAEQGWAVPDTAVVILLGGVGCSADQVTLLRYWSEQQAAKGLQDYPVLAIYADPLLGVEQGAYESLILRRVSKAPFPFIVSQDPDFNLRAMGIQTPQVVLVESQVITHVLNPSTTALNPPALQ